MNLSTLTVCDQSELLIVEKQEIPSISWDHIREATRKDHVLSVLVKANSEEFQNEHSQIVNFNRYKGFLYVNDRVVLYKDRVVMPSSLRQKVLENLHTAPTRVFHQCRSERNQLSSVISKITVRGMQSEYNFSGSITI